MTPAEDDDYMTGEEVAYVYIVINDRRLWLDRYAVEDGVVRGFHDDSEQCENCGGDIEEHGEFKPIGQHAKYIKCQKCGTKYAVQYRRLERGGPPFDHATATGMYDRECDTP